MGLAPRRSLRRRDSPPPKGQGSDIGVFHAPETPYGKELWKWEHFQDETNPIDSTIRGMRPRQFQPYPAMLYRVIERNPLELESAVAMSAVEQRSLEERGFVAGGQTRAIEAHDQQEREFAALAANRAYGEQRMSEAARAEAIEYEAEADGHVPSIPETPIKRGPGRPKRKTDLIES